MSLKKHTDQIHYYLTLLSVVALPFGGAASSISIILLCFNWLLGFNFAERFKQRRSPVFLALFVSVYLLFVIGQFYSANLKYGFHVLETKLSLLLLPLVFSMSKPFVKEQIDNILRLFVASCFLAFLVCVGRIFMLYGIGQSDKYFYMSLSRFIHPGYFSIYFSLVAAIVIYYMDRSINESKGGALVYQVIMLMLILFVQVMLAAKMPLIITFLLLLVAGAIYVKRRKRRSVYMLLGFIVLALVVFLAISKVQVLMTRLDTILEALNTDQIDKTTAESSRVRILVWKEGIKAWNDNYFFGVGTGDTWDVQAARYKAAGMSGALHHELNCHNQYLETGLTIGVVGLFVFLISIILPLRRAIKQNDLLLISLIFILLIGFLTESMLEIQAGTVFYSFFMSLFVFGRVAKT